MGAGAFTGVWEGRLLREFGITAPRGLTVVELRALYAAEASKAAGLPAPRPVRARANVTEVLAETSGRGPAPRPVRIAGRRAGSGSLEGLIAAVAEARVAEQVATDALHAAIRAAHAGGVSLRALEGPSALRKSRLGEIVG